MSWASRRQFKYLTGFITVILLIVFAFTYKIIFKKPTCNDQKQNGTETGIDCGGSCSLVCPEVAQEPVILWSRAFPVIDNNYNLVAYVENRNMNSGIVSVNYEFRVYDSNNKLLGRREGSTFIPPNQQFAIFEPRFFAGENQLKSVAFQFTSPLVWVQKDPTLQKQSISVKNVIFDDNPDTPTLSADIVNDSIYDIPAFDVIAILYDTNHNAINASGSHKERLMNNSSIPVTFTWPEVLSAYPVTKDVLISINPFAVDF
jgi:hypothetical protein